MSDVYCQTSDVRWQMSDVIFLIPDVWCQLSDVWWQTSDMRPQTSDVCHQTSDISQQTSEVWSLSWPGSFYQGSTRRNVKKTVRGISTWYWGLKGWQKPGCISSSELTLGIKLNNPFVTKILWSQEALRNLHFDYPLKKHLLLFSRVMVTLFGSFVHQTNHSESILASYSITLGMENTVKICCQ